MCEKTSAVVGSHSHAPLKEKEKEEVVTSVMRRSLIGSILYHVRNRIALSPDNTRNPKRVEITDWVGGGVGGVAWIFSAPFFSLIPDDPGGVLFYLPYLFL